MPAPFGLWESVFGLLVQCGYGHGKEKMAGVEEESQFESESNTFLGAVDGLPTPKNTTLECCTEIATYAALLTKKLTTGRSCARYHKPVHDFTELHHPISIFGPSRSNTLRCISWLKLSAKDHNTTISNSFSGPPFPLLILILSTLNFRSSRQPSR